jgi:pimeloyl-ACP methyl ester carboxylesterase
LTRAILEPGSVKLADKRTLGFSSIGPSDGFPVIYMHGAIGSPLRVSDDLAATIDEADLRWICVQRPGFGLSDPKRDRTMASFGSDLRELAQQLELQRAAILGVSAGGPYALACGAAAPDVVGAVAVCSSLSPLCPQWEVPEMPFHLKHGLRLLARHPRGCTWALDRLASFARRHPGLLLAVMRRGAPAPSDRELLQNAEAGSTAVNGFLAAAGNGVAGLIDDFLICSRGWGFDLGDVRVPVHLWHGLQDKLVPSEHAWQLASSLPNCLASFDPDEGHFFFRRRVSEIVTRLVEAARRPPRGSWRTPVQHSPGPRRP